jgi:hypothetical protein
MNTNEINYLRFEDWISTKEHEDKEWITVTRHDMSDLNTFPSEDWSTMSALVPNDKETIRRLSEKYTWGIGWNFVESRQGRIYEEDQIHPDIPTVDGVQFEPFILKKGNFPYFSIDFVNRFCLKYNEQDGKYCSGNNVVAELVEGEHLRVKTSYLKKYLKEREMILVRFHDHRRRLNRRTVEILGDEDQTVNVETCNRHYEITIASIEMKSDRTYSRLLGKDMILSD